MQFCVPLDQEIQFEVHNRIMRPCATYSVPQGIHIHQNSAVTLWTLCWFSSLCKNTCSCALRAFISEQHADVCSFWVRRLFQVQVENFLSQIFSISKKASCCPFPCFYVLVWFLLQVHWKPFILWPLHVLSGLIHTMNLDLEAID